MFRETFKKGVYDIQAAKDEYRLSSCLGVWIEIYYKDSWMPNYENHFLKKCMNNNDKINYSDMSSLCKPCLEWSYEEGCICSQMSVAKCESS